MKKNLFLIILFSLCLSAFSQNLIVVSSNTSLSVNGTTVDISTQVQNIGTSSAGASSIGFYLSSNATITTGDYLIGSDYVLSLSPGGTSSESLNIDVTTVTPTIPAGTYYVGHIVDYYSEVSETNESDNTYYFSTPQVTIPPDDLTTELTGANTSSIGGNDGSINLTVNGGVTPYTYDWSNGATTEDISGLSASVYAVTVTDALDSTVVDSIRIYDSFVDERDGQVYKAVTIGGQVWMAENLNYYTPTESMYYDNDSISYSDTYGRLYWLATARQVCPSEWHLPTDDEWKIMESELGMPEDQLNLENWRGTNEGGKLKESGLLHWSSPNSDATNETGFSALPAGSEYSGSYSYLGLSTDFWVYSYSAWYRVLGFSTGQIARGKLPGPDRGLSVRCILDIDTLEISLEPTHTTKINGKNGSIDLTVSGGLSPFTYSWSNGSTTEDISGLSAEVYSVTVTDARDSTATDSIRVYDTFIDERDGTTYKAITIGNQTWMAENLNVGVKIDKPSNSSDNEIIEKYCYDNLNSNCDVYGGLYNWNEAMQYDTVGNLQGICPDGWYIPTDNEWIIMELEIGMDPSVAWSAFYRGTDQGTQLKKGGTSGFEGLYGGKWYGDFSHLEDMGTFWTSSIKEESSPWLRTLWTGSNGVYRGWYWNSCCFSIRCILEPLSIRLEGTNTSSIEGMDGSIDCIQEGGVPPYNYIWSNGATTENVSGLTAGVYSLTVTDALDSTVVDSIRIYDTFIDERDAHIYKAITIGEQIWMAENLNIGTRVNGNEGQNDNEIIEKYCYDDTTINCDIYGGLWAPLKTYVDIFI